eukprot:9640789-Alexandrium_andersonii.AAC.1
MDIFKTRLKDPATHYQDRPLHVVPERSEQEKPRFAMIGRLRAYVESILPEGLSVETKWRPR